MEVPVLSLNVSNAANLTHTKKFVLIAGKGGIEKKIDALGIIEHEKKEEIAKVFREGDFVITNFYSIKDTPEDIFDIVKTLIEIKVSALAIKNLYFKKISEDVIEYANEHDFPIFIYDKEILSEEIIFDIINALKNEDDRDYITSKIYGIINSKLSANMIKKIAYEINRNFKDNVIVSYITEYNDMDHVISAINNGPYRDICSKGIIFENGILVINTFDDDKFNINEFFAKNGIKKNNCFIGESSGNLTLSKLDFGIKEAIFAAKIGVFKNIREVKFEELGIYKFILPNIENQWLRKFYFEFINKIKEYDKNHDGNLLITGKNFVKLNGDYKKTAEHMYQHHNTIRYRVSKIKEISYTEANISGFYEELAIAIMIDEIIDNVNIPKNIL